MEPDRPARVGGRLPHRVVHGVVEMPPFDHRVGTDERPHEVRGVRGALNLGRRRLDVLLRDDRDAEQAVGCVAAEVGEPVVVRAALRDGDVEVLHARDAEQRRRVEDALADAFGVEVGDARCRLERARSEVGVLAFAGGDPRLLLGAHPPGAGQREVVRRVAAAVPDDPLVAVIVGLDVPDAVAVPLGRVLEHLVGMFEHVTVGVDELQIDARIGDGQLVLPVCVHGTARST